MLRTLVDIYSLVVLASVVVSWLSVSPSHPVVRFIHAATEPVLAPLRRVLPNIAGLDLSPMLLLMALRVLARLV